MLTELQIGHLKEILVKLGAMYDSAGHWVYRAYFDQDDWRNNSNLVEDVVSAKNPYEALDDYYNDWVDNVQYWLENEILDELALRKVDIDTEEFFDWFALNVMVDFPIREITERLEVNVNFWVETGESDYDYTLNNFYDINRDDERYIPEESSILWLVKQQGYTEEQLADALFNDNYHDSEFLKSVVEEVRGVTSHMNRLTFLERMTLQLYLDLWDNPEDWTIPTNTPCGLVDHWNGAGSYFEIKLEKEVVIPKDMLRFEVDGLVGYGIKKIYGVSDDFWKYTGR